MKTYVYYWTCSLLAVVCVFGIAAQESAPSVESTATLASDSGQVPTFGTTVVNPSGLRGDIYFIPKGTMVLPDFGSLEPVGVIWTTTLNMPPRHWRDGFPGVSKRNEWFAINYTGRFWIETPGLYEFALASDDGSKLYIDDEPIVDNDCQHPPDVRNGNVMLNGGVHRIRVSYFQGPRDCLALVLLIAGPEGKWRIFNMEEFKPPADPEQWKYSSLTDLTVPPNPNAKRTRLRDLVGAPQEEPAPSNRRAHAPRSPGGGCFVDLPNHNCGS